MPSYTSQDVERLRDAALQLITEYRSTFRTTRYTTDERNVSRLIDAVRALDTAPTKETEVRS